MVGAPRGPVRTVLVGGHESADGADLDALLDSLPGAVVATAGRRLHDAVSALLDSDGSTVAVLPMTWGRDPVMVADTAKSLRWLSAGRGAGRVVLCGNYGTTDHLIALLRRAATETAGRRPGTALVIAAPSSNPFDDAELHRVAHLVSTHGAGSEIEVACFAGPDDLRRALRRARLLGSETVVVVPAGFARSRPDVDAPFYGPLQSVAAMRQVVEQRLAAALEQLDHGRDGIAAGLMADHGHGYAHSHAVDGATHDHAHDHAHDHPHDPGQLDHARADHRVESPTS